MKGLSFRGTCISGLIGLAIAGAVPAAAQEARFSSADGSIEITGTVKAFDGETYVIESLLGVLDISSDTVSCHGDGCPVRRVNKSWSAGEIGAQVSLMSIDDAMNISGKLVMFDGEVIRIRNSIGMLELPFQEVRCAGAGCPEAIEEITYIIPGS